MREDDRMYHQYPLSSINKVLVLFTVVYVVVHPRLLYYGTFEDHYTG